MINSKDANNECFQKNNSLADVIKCSFRSHRYLILGSLVFSAIIFTLALSLGVTPFEFLRFILFRPSHSKLLIGVPLLFIAGFFVRAVYAYLKNVFHKKSLAGLKEAVEIFDQSMVSYFSSKQFWDAVAAMAAILPLVLFFCAGKSLIPHLTHYSWDPLFVEWDRFVHGGVYPHKPLVSLVEALHLQEAANLFYYLFFPFVVLVNGYCIFFDPQRERRHRYLWSILLMWSLGGFLLALTFASVGPIFYADFYPGPSPYTDLISYLTKVSENKDYHVMPLSRILLEWVRDDNILDVNAISAMPSMHVTATAMATYYLWSVSRVLGVLGGIFVILTIATTVYLGVHYAIDGYAGVVMAGLFWWLSKKISSHSAAYKRALH